MDTLLTVIPLILATITLLGLAFVFFWLFKINIIVSLLISYVIHVIILLIIVFFIDFYDYIKWKKKK